jgi:hypothetical protein
MLTFAAFALGLLNLVPLVGLVRPLEFVRLYGVRAETAELRVLLRHRAVLLGCVGAALIIGAADARWLVPALGFAALSKVSFLAIFVLEGRPGAPLARVARADLVGLGGLCAALATVWFLRAG